MKLLFLHGWQSTPGGLKPTYLKDHGHEVLNPALPDDDFAVAVRVAQAEYDRGRPDVVVGSSRGGAVAMNINSGTTPLVLLCPAWKTWGTATTVKPNTIILHSETDDTVPIADSRELLKNSGLPESALIVVGTEHRLADDESLESMVRAAESLGIVVTGIDPAPSKGLTIWSGVASGPEHVPSSAAADWISKESRERKNWLICWDSPLSFDPSISFSDRPVDRVVRAAVTKWVQERIIGPKAVSVRPFSGCPHWSLSCEVLGLPFSKPGRSPYRLASTKEDAASGGVWLVEVHPAVALAVWWAECEDVSIPMPRYKNDVGACRQIAATLGFYELARLDLLDDDVLDSFVACRLGRQFLTGESIWVGDPLTGGYVLPKIAEQKWSLHTKVQESMDQQ